MNNPIIQVKNLSRTYEYFHKDPGIKNSIKNLFHREKLFKHAVNDVGFEINEGELVGFLGPNGAGKTTTLKMLSGILTPTSGEAKVLGYTPYLRQNEYKKQFALVMGQKNQLWWDLPAMESFLLIQKMYDISKVDYNKRLTELSGMLEIKDEFYKQVRKLSLGERMKCELIAALLHNPKVLFLDEPTIGLDVVAQKNIRDFLKKYNQEKKTTIILTSHYMDDISALCERIIVINTGKIIYDGGMKDLVKKYANHKMITVFFEDKITKKEVKDFGKIYEFSDQKVSFIIPRPEVKARAARILTSSLPVHDIEIQEEDVDIVIRNIFQSKYGKISAGA
jgi:ABC-2 type transport system ATP-binding protein